MYKDLTTIEKNVTDIKAINNSIKNIILTRKGSVPGKPKFGSEIHKLLFSQLDHFTETIAKKMISEALNEFEDRIDIINIDIKQVPEYNRLQCTINYRYKDNFNNEQEANATLSLVQ